MGLETNALARSGTGQAARLAVLNSPPLTVTPCPIAAATADCRAAYHRIAATACLGGRSSRVAGLLSLLGLVLALTALPAAAAEPTAPADATAKEQAQTLLSEGNSLIKRGKFVAALKRFRAAHALFPSPKLLINVGTALRHLGRHAEAATAYEQYLAHPEAEPEQAATVAGVLREVEQQVGRISIAVNVPDARLRLDGQLLVGSGQRRTVRVDPGDHTVVAEKPGMAPAIASVAVSKGELSSIDLTLAAPDEPKPDGSTQRIVAYSVAGVGVAGVVVGAVFGGLYLSARSEATDHCDSEVCDEIGADALDEAQTQGVAATIAFVAGGVMLGGSVVIFLTAPSEEDSEPAVATTLRLDPRGVNLEMHW